MMSAIYDYNATSMDDHYLEIAERSIEKTTEAVKRYAWSFFDEHSSIPSTCPRVVFRRWFQSFFQDKIKAGETSDCLAARLLESCRSEDQLADVKPVCMTAYAGGAETTSSTLQGFFYAMINLPDNRLPVPEDRSSLPYIEAVYRESLRWHPVTPIGVPHYTTDKDVYNGTTIILNVWAMTRDPRKYQDPEDLDPLRSLKKNGNLNEDDARYIFGFGRRICPGRHLVAVTIW
ncbi:cytochrome P450 [Crepidotus variabilis]|uniref:Cytochrome P450 n=1 Tax=Crepidotus variabilis TaxID=179855 RepID=A0A9P6E6W2_9AGAR|nr:cytochrome P450 [Crepidotus variabilis]